MTQFIQLFWCIIELWSCAFENFIITICSSLLPTMTVLCLPLNDCPPFWRSSAWDCQACIFMSHHFRVSLNTYLSGLLWFGYLILAVTSKNFWEIHIDNRWQSGFFRLSKLIILSHREPFTICLRCLIIQSMQLFFLLVTDILSRSLFYAVELTGQPLCIPWTSLHICIVVII